MKTTNNLINSAALALALVAGFPLHGDVVSWNKDIFGTIPESGTDTAGVVNAAWWNNSWPDADQDTVNLQDSNNNPTTIDLTLTQPTTYRIQSSGPALDADNPLFPALRSGHRLFQRPSPQKQIPSITTRKPTAAATSPTNGRSSPKPSTRSASSAISRTSASILRS